MKKFFTLVAAALLACSVNAQEKWTSVIVNGDMEGEADPLWSCFWVHDYRQGVEFDEASGQQYDAGGQFQGFAEIVEDPANPANHCAKVRVRSAAEADSVGNAVTADGALAGWDTQFFIYAKVDEPIPAGKMLRVSFKYKADKEGPNPGTQAHANPGNYNHWAMIGNPAFTTEWKTFEWEGILSADQAPEDKGFYSIAFNLADYKDGYTAYFDDVKMEIKDQGEPQPFAGWLNFLRKGTKTADKNGNFTTFTGRNGATGQDIQAEYDEKEEALKVTTVAYNYSYEEPSMVPKITEEGDTVKDETGEVVMVQEVDDETGELKFNTVKKWIKYGEEKNDTIDNIDDWQTQFFVTTPHKWVTGQPYKLVMQVKADKEISIDTQAHTMPGNYVHWQFCGTLNVGTDWTDFSFGDDEDPYSNVIASEANGCQTIAFNCNKEKDEIVNIYFRFVEFSFNKEDVSDSERVLGNESISLPLAAAKNAETEASLDINEGMKVLEIDNFAGLLESSQNVLLKNVKVDPEDQSEEEIFEGIQLTSGAFIDAKGNNTDVMENSIILEASEDSKDGVIDLTITNAGVTLEAGKSVDTKLVLVNDGWRYLYNVSFIDSEVYTGIDEKVIAPKADNVIYDLTGRKLTKAAKGLYIMNGKKFIQK